MPRGARHSHVRSGWSFQSRQAAPPLGSLRFLARSGVRDDFAHFHAL
jgi:hypothetical protein